MYLLQLRAAPTAPTVGRTAPTAMHIEPTWVPKGIFFFSF